jgi:biopolymer transport protein TolR
MRNSSARVRRRKQRIAEMNVVPYIDVMLVLLIIFMTTSTFISEDKKLEIPLSSVGKNVSENPSIIIDESENYFLRESMKVKEKPASSVEQAIPFLKALKNKSKKPEEFRVLLSVNRNISYGKVLDIKEQLRKAGLESSLITKSK